MANTSPVHYNNAAITLHWSSAALVIILLATGFRLDDASPDEKMQWLRVHAPAGLLLLILTLGRILVLCFSARVAPAPGPTWARLGARFVHAGSYVLIVVMLASGLALMLLSGAAPLVFGAGAALPDFDTYPPRAPHGLGAKTLVVLLVAHIGAALYHHFVLRDGVFKRIWYRR